MIGEAETAMYRAFIFDASAHRSCGNASGFCCGQLAWVDDVIVQTNYWNHRGH